MSLFDNNLYQWRETYFVYFHAKDRPKLETVEKALKKSEQRLELENATADDDGYLEGITIYAHDSNAAMDIAFLSDEEVAEACEKMVGEMTGDAGVLEDPEKLAKLDGCDARLEVMHFEEMVDFPALDEDELDEMLEPMALLSVLGAIESTCHGVAVDPQSGTFP